MWKSKVVIIDYGSGNLQSVFNALELVKNSSHLIQISSNPADLISATCIILPGVGAFGDCISSLKAIDGMVEELQTQVLKNKKPFLGICVGMQLLADFGFEYGKHSGLGFVAGDVVEVNNQNNTLKVPHIGWNNISIKKPHPVLNGIKDGEHFYFVHSFYAVPANQSHTVGSTEYGAWFTSAIARDTIFATQFHPEKSAEYGLRLYQNFTTWQP